MSGRVKPSVAELSGHAAAVLGCIFVYSRLGGSWRGVAVWVAAGASLLVLEQVLGSDTVFGRRGIARVIISAVLTPHRLVWWLKRRIGGVTSDEAKVTDFGNGLYQGGYPEGGVVGKLKALRVESVLSVQGEMPLSGKVKRAFECTTQALPNNCGLTESEAKAIMELGRRLLARGSLYVCCRNGRGRSVLVALLLADVDCGSQSVEEVLRVGELCQGLTVALSREQRTSLMNVRRWRELENRSEGESKCSGATVGFRSEGNSEALRDIGRESRCAG